MFTVLVFNSSVFAQKARTSKVKPVVQGSSVVYSGAEAFSDGRGVWLRWQTESETKNLGFFVYRASGKNTQLASRNMIPGGYLRAREDQTFGGNYTFFDPDGNAGTIYYIESLNAEGQRQTSNPIFPQYVKDLSEFTGTSTEAMRAASDNSNSQIIKSDLILSKELSSEIEANTLQADLNTQRFLAGQPGVKIGVRKEGLVRVTRAELQAAGFDVNSSPALWQLYKDGVEQSIIVGGSGDYIEFYGKGIDTLESDLQVYFLIAGQQNGKRMGTRILRPFAGNVVAKSYAQTFTQKERSLYLSSILNGDANNFFGPVIASTGATINFNLSSVDFSVSKTLISISVQGYSFFSHNIRIVLNGQELDSLAGENTDTISRDYGVPTALLREGANTLQLTSMNGTQDLSFFDKISVNYSRLYEAKNNQLGFYTNYYRTSNLTGFSSANIRVFDLSRPDDPALITNLPITQNGGTYAVRLPANRSYMMYAIEDSAVASAASIIQNVPSTLATPAHNANLLIVTHKDWMTEANTWANYRRAQGFSVEVLDVEDIYDEYSYGTMNTDGIRTFLQYAKNNWQTPPQYLFILGDANYDYRNFEGTGYHNYVPTKMVDTVYMETGSDEALADFNDDGLSEIAVGRIPVRDGLAVTHAFNKTTAFEQTVGQWQTRGALFAFDAPNGYDFESLSDRLRQQLPANMQSAMVGRLETDAHTNVINAINQGKYIVNYSGHGSTGFWSASSFFSSTDALALTNSNLSLFTMLTCLNGYFINNSDSLSEALIKSNGGAVATWTSTGKTTPDVQEVMAVQFYGQITAGNMPRIGDLIKDAKTVVVGGRDVRLSWVLLGDPTLKVR